MATSPLESTLSETVTRVRRKRRHGDDAAVLEAARARIGDTLDGALRLDRLLAVGGSAAVYAATDGAGRRAAVKVLTSDALPPTTLMMMATWEALMSRSVGHPGAVAIEREAMAADGTVYLVMPLLVGPTLEGARREAGGTLAPDVALPVFDALLDVVAAAHDRRVVHHDVKPGNVLITGKGPHLLDFGLARRAGQLEASVGWFGTPGFIAPEKARAEPSVADTRADIWSLGASMFVVLSGHDVHPSPSREAEVLAAGTRPARSLGEVASWLPRRIIEVVDRALAFHPADRWPDARAMRAALRAPAAPTMPPPRRLYAY